MSLRFVSVTKLMGNVLCQVEQLIRYFFLTISQKSMDLAMLQINSGSQAALPPDVCHWIFCLAKTFLFSN
jgi:hypothetical protein